MAFPSMDSPGFGEAAPPELLRYRFLVFLLGLGYIAVFVAMIVAHNIPDALTHIFVPILSFMMVCRANQCLALCVMPFGLLTVLGLLFDAAALIDKFHLLSSSAYFSVNCPQFVNVFVLNGTPVIYHSALYKLMTNTTAEQLVNDCSVSSLVGNIALVVRIVLGVLSMVVALRMWAVVLRSAPEEGGQFGGFGGLLGGMGAGGENGGGGDGTGAAAPQRATQGFQPFRGQGQALGG
mmetsp:Transcript_51011/g.136049  ORF Transcript_51011/g.136049 Transcript_51011/m.136049 type:complete len:236 (-) Transcript_51011:22-729(-)